MSFEPSALQVLGSLCLIANLWVSRRALRVWRGRAGKLVVALLLIWLLPFSGAIVVAMLATAHERRIADAAHWLPRRSAARPRAEPESVEPQLLMEAAPAETIPIRPVLAAFEALAKFQSSREALVDGLRRLAHELGDTYALRELAGFQVLSPLSEAALASLGVEWLGMRRSVVEAMEGLPCSVAPGGVLLVLGDEVDLESVHRLDSALHRWTVHASPHCAALALSLRERELARALMVHRFVLSAPEPGRWPRWLAEGLALALESRLTSSRNWPPAVFSQHEGVWAVEEVRQFWSGQAFDRVDDLALLSCDLAHCMVEELMLLGPRFKDFVRFARAPDGGQTAASDHLEIDLATLLAGLVDEEATMEWVPGTLPAV